MKIEMTNAELDKFMQSLTFQRLFNHQLPAKLSYGFSVISKELEEKVNIYREERMKLIERLGDRDESGELIREGDTYFFNDNMDQFNKEHGELISINPTFKEEKIQVTFQELDDTNLKFSPFEINDLGFVIELIENGDEGQL